jgi:hypothetical protein
MKLWGYVHRLSDEAHPLRDFDFGTEDCPVGDQRWKTVRVVLDSGLERDMSDEKFARDWYPLYSGSWWSVAE